MGDMWKTSTDNFFTPTFRKVLIYSLINLNKIRYHDIISSEW